MAYGVPRCRASSAAFTYSGHDFAPLLRYISIRIRPNGRILAQRGAGSKCFSAAFLQEKEEITERNKVTAKKVEIKKGQSRRNRILPPSPGRRCLFLFSNERYTVNGDVTGSAKTGIKKFLLFFCGCIMVCILNRSFSLFSITLQGGASI